jgi:hypothetical protein
MVFIPLLTILHQQEEFAEEKATLRMNACPSHVKPEVLGIFTVACVRIITFALHMMHKFQILDFTLFGAFKNRGRYQLPFETGHRTANSKVRCITIFERR